MGTYHIPCWQALDKCLSLQKKVMTGVTHQKYRLGVIKRLMGDVETITKEEKGEVQDLNKVRLWDSA